MARYKGKRTGSRRAAAPKRRFRPALALLALGITLAIIGWGYLVWIAIEFGGDARSGESTDWLLLALAAIGACACLFVALLLVARLSRALGITSGPTAKQEESPRHLPAIEDEPPPDPQRAGTRNR